jgi:hypothetical protein
MQFTALVGEAAFLLAFGAPTAADRAAHRSVLTYLQMRLNQAPAMTNIFGVAHLFSPPAGGVLSDAIFRISGFQGRVRV